MSTARKDAIANQIFIGCPWKTVRAKYERIIARLNRKYPLAFVIVGRRDGQMAEDLLKNFRRAKPGQKKRSRSLALKIIHQLDGQPTARRTDIVQAMQADPSQYTEDEADRMILALHKAGLVQSLQGPYSKVRIK